MNVGVTTTNMDGKTKSEATLDGQDIVNQEPDIVLTPAVSGSSREYTNISLSGSVTRNLSEVTEGTDYQGKDAADFNLEKTDL